MRIGGLGQEFPEGEEIRHSAILANHGEALDVAVRGYRRLRPAGLGVVCYSQDAVGQLLLLPSGVRSKEVMT